MRKFRQIAVWQILPTCIFTDIVGIIEANYKNLAETVTGSADGAILRMKPEELLDLLEGTE